MGNLYAIIAFAAVAATTATNQGGDDGRLQYGALGLCGLMVCFLISHIKAQAKVIEKKDNKLIELLEKDIESRNNLSECLKDRPCLSNDSRTEG